MLKFIKGLFETRANEVSNPKSPTPSLQPESQYIVTCSETSVKCQKPDGSIECVKWVNLQSVVIVTTDEGPFYPDVFWFLNGSTESCIIPQGATGEAQLLEKLQQLPEFDNEPLIKAMSSTSNANFLCWQRQPD